VLKDLKAAQDKKARDEAERVQRDTERHRRDEDISRIETITKNLTSVKDDLDTQLKSNCFLKRTATSQVFWIWKAAC
jgi:hypothetical protein